MFLLFRFRWFPDSLYGQQWYLEQGSNGGLTTAHLCFFFSVRRFSNLFYGQQWYLEQGANGSLVMAHLCFFLFADDFPIPCMDSSGTWNKARVGGLT